jgi:hypothetical protein
MAQIFDNNFADAGVVIYDQYPLPDKLGVWHSKNL